MLFSVKKIAFLFSVGWGWRFTDKDLYKGFYYKQVSLPLWATFGNWLAKLLMQNVKEKFTIQPQGTRQRNEQNACVLTTYRSKVTQSKLGYGRRIYFQSIL